jgi:hypothetical protein
VIEIQNLATSDTVSQRSSFDKKVPSRKVQVSMRWFLVPPQKRTVMGHVLHMENGLRVHRGELVSVNFSHMLFTVVNHDDKFGRLLCHRIHPLEAAWDGIGPCTNLYRLNMGNSNYYGIGQICLDNSIKEIMKGEMGPIDAFWNSTFEIYGAENKNERFLDEELSKTLGDWNEDTLVQMTPALVRDKVKDMAQSIEMSPVFTEDAIVHNGTRTPYSPGQGSAAAWG